MNHLYKHIRPVLFAVLAALLLPLGGCSGSRDDEPVNDDALMVSFRVVTPKAQTGTAASRATWEDDYISETGESFDYTLLSDLFRVIITDSDCTEEFSRIHLVWCVKKSETDEGIEYEYLGRVESGDVATVREIGLGKLQIIANMPDKPALTDDPIFAMWGQPADNFRAIPMWGVASVDFSGIKQGERFDAGEVKLLRAMAKVEIVIDPTVTDPPNSITSLTSVTAGITNSKGYLLPADWSTVTETVKVDRDNVRIPADRGQQTGVTVATAPTGDDAEATVKLSFYLPEISNTATDEVTLTLAYESTDGDFENALYFRTYTGGKPTGEPHDIVRNHLYRYVVSRPEKVLKVEADVIPYTEVILEPEFGIKPKP